MPINLYTYRARIGLHRHRLFKLKGYKHFNSFEFVILLAMLLYQAGDVEKSPWPQSDNDNNTSFSSSPVFNGEFSVVHYNVQSLLH